MAKKTTFHIPSVDEIAKFEREEPKVQSHFKAHKESESSSNVAKDKGALTVQSNSSSKSAHKPKSVTVNQFIRRKSGHSSQNGTSVNSSEQGKRKDDHLSTTAGGESRKKQFVGSSFAAKFGSLPLVEGEDDHRTTKAQSNADSEITKPGTSSKPSSAVNKTTTNSILVNPRQRGNPLLKSVRNIPWEFADIVPDYVMGRTTCALFLSLRYHHLNPNYIHNRLKELGYNYELRILLVQVDVKDPHYSLKELARMAILAECTLILAWSPEEAGRYLETYKSYENKPVDALKERVEQDFVAQVTDCLTTVKSVNRTDVVTLLSSFGTVANIISAKKEELNLLPGFGPQKAERLHDIFREPFHKRSTEVMESST